MVYIFWDNENERKDSFTFTFSSSCPSVKFSFDRPKALPVLTNRPFKRRRALSDVDGSGDGNEARKKRRLRLHLITSRLSRPYSQPATNIVNRSGSKVAVLGVKDKAIGRSELRKAAIMNRVRMRMDEAKDFIRQENERGRAKLSMREIVLQKPRTHEPPLPPSPLGLSNYDAFDLEDEMDSGDEDHSDGGSDGCSTIYSDFNVMNPITSDGDDFDYLDAIDGIPTQDLPDSPPQPPEETIVGMLREEKRQEGCFVVEAGMIQ